MKKLSIVEKAKAYDEAVINGSRLWECGDITRENYEYIFPELKESEDEKVRKAIIQFFELQDDNTTYSFISKKDILAWLEKQGEFKSNKWKEGDVVRYGGVLALVTNGRKAMKSNCEQITIQYPDEWVKAETKERKYFFEELEKQGEQKPANKKEEIDNLHNYLYSEQKHDNVEPKFKVGDKIIEKDFDECSCGTIIDIKDDKYIFDNGGFIYVKEQSLWKLVEQKTTDKIKPKFHEGDWITDNNSTFQIVRVENEWYHADDGDKICFDVAHQYYHLWTIQDAKDGDVLACKNEILLFKSYSAQNRISLYCWYNGQTNNFHNKEVADASLTTRNKICPATKEQCDLLFQKMKEVGYEWDDEKKELKKIEQKSAQSEKDAENISMLIDLVESKEESMEVKIELSTWLNSLKERVQPQLKQGEKGTNGNDREIPFSEQKPVMIQWQGNNLKEVIDFTGKDKHFDKWFKSLEEYEQYVQEHDGIFKLFNADGSHYEVPIGAWIVKTPDGHNVASKATFKQNSAWSEEDEEKYYGVIETEHYMLDVVNGIKKFDVGNISIKEECTRELNWLKSLKDRYAWKPSEEQMKALSSISVTGTISYAEQGQELIALYNDLRELREE